MSSTEEDEKKVYVERQTNPSAAGSASTVVVREPAGAVPVQPVVAEPVITQTTVPNEEKRESVVKHTSTNTSALVGLAIGVIILAMGLFLVMRETPFLPYPYSIFAILVVGIALIGVGASLVSNRTSR